MKKLPLIALLILLGAQFAPLFSQMVALSEEEQQDLQYMLEEEKLARDVYVALNEKWDHLAFQKISASEERHFSSLKLVAQNHNLSVPATVKKDQPGLFKNKELQARYNAFVTTGNQSLVAALQVGAKIEELDIKDLEAAQSRTKNEQLKGLYTRLQTASEKHLRTFSLQLKQQGLDYTPVILGQAEYDNIINQAKSQGKACAGKGKGKGCCQGDKAKGKSGAGCGSGKACCSGKQ